MLADRRRNRRCCLEWVAGTLLATAAALTPASDAVDIGQPIQFSSVSRPGQRVMDIRLGGALELRAQEMAGLTVTELSGLAWDDDAGLLYAVSDNGHVLHLVPGFERNELVGVELVGAYPLRDDVGRRLSGAGGDAEGVTVRDGRNGVVGDSRLIISFERRPRILEFTPAGAQTGVLSLPAELATSARYSSPNKGLEALTWHPKYGYITGPERPLRDVPSNRSYLYTLDGRHWSFSPIDPGYGALVGLETAPDGSLVAIERRFISFFRPLVIALRRIELGDDRDVTAVTELARFDSTGGWAVDNFESVARHRGNHYFMVSDDNASVLQKTLLVYFEIVEPAAPEAPTLGPESP